MVTRHLPLKTALNPRYQKCICERCSKSVDGYTPQLPRAARIHMHYYPPKQSKKRVSVYNHHHNIISKGHVYLQNLASTVINLNVEPNGNNIKPAISDNTGSRIFSDESCANVYRINFQYPNHEFHLNQNYNVNPGVEHGLNSELYRNNNLEKYFKI